jgi:hypothetical protein
MQTPDNVSKLVLLKSNEPPQSRYTLHIARLANFIEHHRYAGPKARDFNGSDTIEVRRTDADIAFHLGISMAALEQCFAELIRQKVIRLRGAHQIEILDKSRLSDFARQKS